MMTALKCKHKNFPVDVTNFLHPINSPLLENKWSHRENKLLLEFVIENLFKKDDVSVIHFTFIYNIWI